MDCKVWSAGVKYKVWSVKCTERSVKCGVWSVSLKCRV